VIRGTRPHLPRGERPASTPRDGAGRHIGVGRCPEPVRGFGREQEAMVEP
jgi:hypothetical protein